MNYDYGLISPNPTVEESWLAGLGAAALVAVVILALIVLAVCILMKGLIPLYNSWIETKITGLGWWWFLIFAVLTAIIGTGNVENAVISMALVLTSFNYNFNLAKKFGKTNGFAVLSTIFPYVCIPILAFGSAQYNKDAEVDENGVFSIKK